MRDKAHDALNNMKESGTRLIEIENIRTELRKNKAPKEAFLSLDRRHRAELASLKAYKKHLLLGLLFLIGYVLMGLFGGVVATICLREEKYLIGIVSALCSTCLLYLGKKELIE